MDREDIIKLVKQGEVKKIMLWFTDILGKLKGFSISPQEIERALDEGINFDGSSIEGLVRIEESDLTAKPDLNSVYLIPDDGANTLVLICDIYYPDGSPVESSPRYVLRNTLHKAMQEFGFKYYTGPELEFFLFSSKEKIETYDSKGYFDIAPYDQYDEICKRTVELLNLTGINVEMVHHEVAENQYEIDFRYDEALIVADHLQVAKYIIKKTAEANSVFATFMPKPVFGANGSGLHVHQSLFKDNKNIFFQENDEYHLSQTAKHYIAGMLKYAKEMTSVTNQWVNSYKRLVAGYEAPVYVSWGRQNRSALLRVPAFKEQRPSSCRVEYRAPDPATNPYLAFSVMLGAGLSGIRENILPPPPIEKDIYSMSAEQKDKLRIQVLPDSLYAAIIETEHSEFVRDIFKEQFFKKYIDNKKAEWEHYRIQVTDYEKKKYICL